MKFSHSLLFNAVPEWTSSYIKCVPFLPSSFVPLSQTARALITAPSPPIPTTRSYEQLKSAIYRFEKSALTNGPPTSYTDEPTPASLESGPEASSIQTHTPSTNEKIFTRLLDQELHKITEFYVDKERELLGDYAMLQADVERIQEEEMNSQSGTGGMMTGGSDSGGSDYDDYGGGGEDDEGGLTRKIKGAITNVFSNPKNYEAATRAGRRAKGSQRRNRSRSMEGPRPSGSGSGSGRARAFSNVSRESDLLDLDEEAEEEGAPLVPGLSTDSINDTSITVQPNSSQRPPLPHPQSQPPLLTPSKILPPIRRVSSRVASSPQQHRRAASRTTAGYTTGGEEDEDMYGGHGFGAGEGEGVWKGDTDWAIDNRIVYKKRVIGIYTVSPPPSEFCICSGLMLMLADGIAGTLRVEAVCRFESYGIQ